MQPKTHLTNDELASVYDYLKGYITNTELNKELSRSRTNTYYYIGRAMEYWLKLGILHFKVIQDAQELGGKDLEVKGD